VTEQQRQKEHERQVKNEMDSCIHFSGIQHTKCRAGVNIRELVGGSDFGWASRLPCLLSDAPYCTTPCDKRQMPTRDEAEAEVKKHDELFERTMLAIHSAKADAKANGYGVGAAGRGEVDCPLCSDGKIRYSVAGVNGHMHAACTNGCTSWME
jgi:hypothetical protein